MLVKPVAAHGRGRDEAYRLVILAENPVGFAVLPRSGAERVRPSVGVALTLDADEHGGGGVLVRLRVPPSLVLADPQIKAVARHERLDPSVAGRAAVIEWQVGVDDVRNEIGASHGSPRIGSGSISSLGLK